MAQAATYRTEFPRFGELDIALPEGFVDQSWSQDICPSFGIHNADTERTGVAALTLFIDYANAADREDPNLPRFAATTDDPTDSKSAWLHTDDWDEMLAWIEANRPKATGSAA